jgi:iron only hydrogenase large subunit-like protein
MKCNKSQARLLTFEEMVKAIRQMGLDADKEGREINQTLRFETIAKAQHSLDMEFYQKEMGKLLRKEKIIDKIKQVFGVRDGDIENRINKFGVGS